MIALTATTAVGASATPGADRYSLKEMRRSTQLILLVTGLPIGAMLVGCGIPADARPTLVPTSSTATTAAPLPSTRVPQTTVVPPSTTQAATTTTVPNPVGRTIDRVDTIRPRIALTFNSIMTDEMLLALDQKRVDSYANVAVLDVLERQSVPATFFLAGKWVLRYPELTKRIAGNGLFEVGSHSFQYKGFTAKCGPLGAFKLDEMAADVTKSFDALRPFGGRQVPYFRFPGGCVDEQALAQLESTRVSVVGGDVVSGDATGIPSATIVSNVVRQAKAGSIVAFHITKGNAPNTHTAVEQVVTELRRKGFELVTVSELLRDAP